MSYLVNFLFGLVIDSKTEHCWDVATNNRDENPNGAFLKAFEKKNERRYGLESMAKKYFLSGSSSTDLSYLSSQNALKCKVDEQAEEIQKQV